MAIVQRGIPRNFERPAARSVVLPDLRERKQVSPRATEQTTTGSMVAGLVVAVCLVMYISGYARMTGVNYQRVKIKRDISLLETQHELLATDLIRKGSKETVEAWAASNQMTPPSLPAVVLTAGGSTAPDPLGATGERRLALGVPAGGR